MTDDLPQPPIPAEVDLRDQPLPVDFFVDLAVRTYGITPDEAQRFIEEYQSKLNAGSLAL